MIRKILHPTCTLRVSDKGHVRDVMVTMAIVVSRNEHRYTCVRVSYSQRACSSGGSRGCTRMSELSTYRSWFSVLQTTGRCLESLGALGAISELHPNHIGGTLQKRRANCDEVKISTPVCDREYSTNLVARLY